MNLCKYNGTCAKVQEAELARLKHTLINMDVLYILFLIYALILIVVLGATAIILFYATIFGGPYAPVAYNRIETMIKLLKLKKGQKMVDLGSGDGRIVIEFAKRGIEAHGYEINPVLVWISRYKIRKAGLRKLAFIHFKDYWMDNFSKFDSVTLFVSPLVTGRVGNKLKRELKKNCLVVSNSFEIPHLKAVKEENGVWLYKI